MSASLDSSGEVPDTINQMAVDAVCFIEALNLKKVDLLGFSIGGMVVQIVSFNQPELVRQVVHTGTASRDGEGPFPLTNEAKSTFSAKYERPEDL
jgi:pimeloyl-ACP methyl ester carboxylesterase